MEVSKFNGQKLYTGLRLDYRLGLWAPTSASRAISAVAVLLVFSSDAVQKDTYSVIILSLSASVSRSFWSSSVKRYVLSIAVLYE